jgi:hypothetical protein
VYYIILEHAYDDINTTMETAPNRRTSSDKKKETMEENTHSLIDPQLEIVGDSLEEHLPRPGRLASSRLRHVTRVSKRAALATKAQIWDSNDAGIVAAQSAVDQWEEGYDALRGLCINVAHSAKGLYGAAKAGANGLEHGLLVPVRDWVLLPAFGSVERIAGGTVGFLHSSQAEQLAQDSLGLVQRVPFVGENILAPALCISAEVFQKAWQIAQYPIPSPNQVHDSVDFVMTGTKWALTTAGREMALYIKRADANITRTLSHTQWKVLGSGPYATLDKLNKREVIDHLCERYFSLVDAVARYELAAHIRAHNRTLYHDLVLTGVLRDRGKELTEDDAWLSSCPSYRSLEPPFLLEGPDENDECVFPLWFRLPYQNGKRPGRDAPWVRFQGYERRKLEAHYRSILENTPSDAPTTDTQTTQPACEQQHLEDHNVTDDSARFPTIAKWYTPTPDDVLVDQRRNAVSFFPCCPKCRQQHMPPQPPLAPRQFGELCHVCSQRDLDAPWVDALLSPPPLSAILRPTMWRFYGPGDEVRRAVWFLDTQRHGIQPYGEQAQAVLEDAYWFLKWLTHRRVWDGSILLTVQVPSPDGSENQLVQFSSLTLATAIGKGLGGAISLFKRRVYRGACRPTKVNVSDDASKPTNADNSTSREKTEDKEAAEPLDVLPTIAEAVPEGDKQTLGSSDAADEYSEERVTEIVDYTTSHLSDVDQFSTSEDIPFPDPSISCQNPGQEASGKAIYVTKSDSSIKLDAKKEPTVEDTEMDVLQDNTTGKGNAVQPTTNDQIDQVQSHVAATDIVVNKIEKGEKPTLVAQLKQRFEQQVTLAFPFDEADDSADILDVESNDQNVDQLVLVIHGVGEMLQSIDLFGLSRLPTIVDCCGFLRKNHAEVLDVRFSQLYQTLDGMSEPIRRGRVEYLPVEWHESFTIQSQRRLRTGSSVAGNGPSGVTIDDISLRTIPQMRQFANDTLMDVLYFMSPEHHDIMIDIVVNEMNFVVHKFRDLTGFQGDISVVGHSLGSIITWDILDHQLRQGLMPESHGRRNVESSEAPETAGPDREEFHDASSVPQDPPERTSPVDPQSRQEVTYPQLDFAVDNAFMLGSPIAVFLMMRNQREPLRQDFSLNGCSRVFNIFHPYDPV